LESQQIMTTLENNLLPASSVWNTERFFGWKVSSVSVAGQDGKNYFLVKPHRGFAWNFQVVEGDSKDGPVVLHITKGGCGTTVTIKNPKTEEVIEMKAPSFWRRIRVFSWRGQEYVWKRSSKMFAKDVTYSLTPADNPSLALAENTWRSGFFLKGTGRITVF